MQQRYQIPNTELRLSPIGLGAVKAGVDWAGADADRLLDAYVDLGGNVIDTARVYADFIHLNGQVELGRSERVIGEWIGRSGKRDQVLLITKGGHPKMVWPTDDIHISRMTPADMRYDIELSLKALHTDTIDIYFYHRDDRTQSVEEEIETMEQFRREGKLRYYACSNWELDRIVEADKYCKAQGYRGFVADQALLNLGSAYMPPQKDDTVVALKGALYDYHVQNADNLAIAYRGAAAGFFHLYIEGGVEAVRLHPYYSEENIRRAERVRELMQKYGATVSQVILGYFFVLPFHCLPLYGPQNIAQLKDAMDACSIRFQREDFTF